MHKFVKCFERFYLFIFSFPSICFSNTHVVISKSKEVSLYSKFFRRNQVDKIYIYKLAYFFCSIVRCVIIIFCYFYSFIAIAYIFILNRVDIMACQIFSQCQKVKICTIFMLNHEGKVVTLCEIYFWLNILVGIVFGFEEIGR